MFIVTNHLIVSPFLKNEENELPLLVNSIYFCDTYQISFHMDDYQKCS